MSARESTRQPYGTLTNCRNPGPAEYYPQFRRSAKVAQLSCSRRRFNYMYQSFSAGAIEEFPLIGPGRYTVEETYHKAQSGIQIPRYSNATTVWSLAVAGMTRDLEAEPSCQQYQYNTNWRRPKHAAKMTSRGLSAETLDEQIALTRSQERRQTPAPNQYNVRRSKSVGVKITPAERNMGFLPSNNPFINTRRAEYESCVGAYELRGRTPQGGMRRPISCAFSKHGRDDAPVYEKTFLTQPLRIEGVNE